jgi:hypothetical protein
MRGAAPGGVEHESKGEVGSAADRVTGLELLDLVWRPAVMTDCRIFDLSQRLESGCTGRDEPPLRTANNACSAFTRLHDAFAMTSAAFMQRRIVAPPPVAYAASLPVSASRAAA